MARTILHVDMDAFYAAIEQRERPELRGKPVIVGGSVEDRGVVSAASYEARRFGVHSAQPTAQARRLCPEGVFLPVRPHLYRQVSRQVMAILRHYTPLVEPLSIDEAFLDVTGSRSLFGDGEAIARAIQARIRSELQLTASVGVAPNKFLAKLASDLRKPNGLVVVPPDQVAAFLRDLPVSRLWGVGPATERQLTRLGLRTIGEVAACPVAVLRLRLGAAGEALHRLAHGEDDRPVEPDTEAKSIGRETTFAEDIGNTATLERVLLALAEEVAARLRRKGVCGRTITLKLRFADFTTLTRARSLSEPTALAETIYPVARDLFRAVERDRKVRLLGVTVSNLTPGRPARQLNLFVPLDDRRERLAETVDALRERFGDAIVQRARLLRRDHFR
ncbi:MAG: DNA polymerase IV [Armatimonadetes bacterium]|nr:DNA polymerase IV [Armatimonadota bacterium]